MCGNNDSGGTHPPQAVIFSILDASRNGRTRRFIESLSQRGWTINLVGTEPKQSIAISGTLQLGRSFLGMKIKAPWPLRRLMFRIGLFVVNLFGARRLTPVAERLSDWFLGTDLLADELCDTNDLVMVEDFHLLAVALLNRKSRPLIYDSRDHYHRLYDERRLWRATIGRALTKLSAELLPRCSAIITVSDTLAMEFQREFALDATVIRSIPRKQSEVVAHASPQRRDLRLVYQGAVDSNRRLGTLIAAVRDCPAPVTLDLFLVGPWWAIWFLKLLALGSSQVVFRAPVPFSQIVRTMRDYDLGVVAYRPISVNMAGALPNKFFEYLHAGVPVMVGPTAEMAGLVRSYRCGHVLDELSKSAIVNSLTSISSDDLARWRNGVEVFSTENSWSHEDRRFQDLISSLCQK